MAVGSISFPGATGAPAIYPLPGRTIYICTANPRRVQEMKFLVKHIHRAHDNPLPPSPSQAARVLPPQRRGRSSLPESWSKSRQRLPDFKLQSQSLRFCGGGDAKPAARDTAWDGNREPNALVRATTVLIRARSDFSRFKILMLMKSPPKRTPGINCHLIIATRWRGKKKSRHAQNVLTSNSCGLSERECILCPFLIPASPSPFSPLLDFFSFFFSPFLKRKANSLGQQLRAGGRAQTKSPPPFKGPGAAKLGSPHQRLVSSLIKPADEESLHRHHCSSHLLPSPLPPVCPFSLRSSLPIIPVTFPINTRPGRENPS